MTGLAPPMSDHRRALRVASVGFVLYGLLALLLLVNFGGHIEWFAKFGRTNNYTPYAQQLLGPDLLVPLDDGHDGQAYWLQARDPLLFDGAHIATIFERPAYRAQRMLYPLLAAPGRLAGEQGVLWALLLVNLVVVFVGTYITTRLALSLRAPPKTVIVFLVNPVVFISVLMDFADALAVTCIITAVFLIRRERWGWAIVAAVAAVLTKEVSLVSFVAIAALHPGLTAKWRVLLAGVPALAGAAWAIYARSRLGWPTSDIQEFTFIPFYGYWDSYVRGWSLFGNWGDAAGAFLVLAVTFWGAIRWQRRRTLELTAALPYLLIVPFASIYVVDLLLNLFRVIGPAITLIGLDLYAGRGVRSAARTHVVSSG